MADITNLLRAHMSPHLPNEAPCVRCTAAAEIERLRSENQRMRRVFEEAIRILNSGGDDAR